MLRGIVGLSLAALVLMIEPASADDKKPKRGGEAVLKKLDTDKDGSISKDEFKKLAEQGKAGKLKDKPELVNRMFGRLDANKDGSLSAEEMKKLGENAKKKKKP